VRYVTLRNSSFWHQRVVLLVPRAFWLPRLHKWFLSIHSISFYENYYHSLDPNLVHVTIWSYIPLHYLMRMVYCTKQSHPVRGLPGSPPVNAYYLVAFGSFHCLFKIPPSRGSFTFLVFAFESLLNIDWRVNMFVYRHHFMSQTPKKRLNNSGAPIVRWISKLSVTKLSEDFKPLTQRIGPTSRCKVALSVTKLLDLQI
jgi:hypothetical protein